jgi:hypothetical protein
MCRHNSARRAACHSAAGNPRPGNPRGVTTPPTSGKKRGPWIGVAGLGASLLGLLSCGVLSPVALVISLAGLRGRPRGFAVVGTAISAIGTLFLAGGITAAVLGEQAARERHQNAVRASQAVKHMQSLARVIESHREVVGAVPLSLSELSTLPAEAVTDPWGSEYRYTPNLEEQSFKVFSSGPDMTPETDDDIQQGIGDKPAMHRDSEQLGSRHGRD